MPPTSAAASKQRRPAASRSCPPKALLLRSKIHSQARQSKTRHVIARQPASYDLGRPRILDGCRAQTVEPRNRLIVPVVNRQEHPGAAQFVTFACIPLQELIQSWLTAIELLPVMCPADRLLMPTRHFRDRRDSARAAARSFGFGADGCSSSLKTRRLSLSDRETCSASSMMALAARRA